MNDDKKPLLQNFSVFPTAESAAKGMTSKRVVPSIPEAQAALEKKNDPPSDEERGREKVKVIVREIPWQETWFPRDLYDVAYWCKLGRGLLLIGILVGILLLLWGVSFASSSSQDCCAVSKCTLNADIPDVAFVSGTTNITKSCYYGGSQIIYYPPTDSLNFDFATSSLYTATLICRAAITQSFSCYPNVVPYMANNNAGTAAGVYTACSIVFDCSFKKYFAFP